MCQALLLLQTTFEATALQRPSLKQVPRCRWTNCSQGGMQGDVTPISHINYVQFPFLRLANELPPKSVVSNNEKGATYFALS